MPNTIFQPTTTGPNQYFKFEKESNNNNIKKNVNAPMKKNAGAPVGEKAKTYSTIPNVFERLSRPSTVQNYRLARRSENSGERSKLLLRQNSQLNKKSNANPYINKSVHHPPAAEFNLLPPRKERQSRKTNASQKSNQPQIVSPLKRQENASSYYSRPLKTLADQPKSFTLPVTFQNHSNNESLDYLIPVPKTIKMPSFALNRKVPSSKKSALRSSLSPPPLPDKEQAIKSQIQSGEELYLKEAAFMEMRELKKLNDAMKNERQKNIPCPTPISTSPLRKPASPARRRTTSPPRRATSPITPTRSPTRQNSKSNESPRKSSRKSPKRRPSSGNTSQIVSSRNSVSFPLPSVSVVSSARVISSEESLDSNILTENVQDILARKDADLTVSDVHVLKNVVKCDRRARKLRTDDSIVFKDILKSQLKDILKQEHIVVSALSSMDKNIPKNLLDSPNPSSTGRSIRKVRHFEMDHYVEQVPLLEKEIMLLRTLGERLELKLLQNELEKKSVTTSVTDLRERFQHSWLVVVAIPKIDYVQHVAQVKSICRVYGIVQEFCVVKKTLLELKQEADKRFYVPQQSELKVTTFEELKQKPSVLRRYLHPKNPETPFNLLDHDSMFFNDILLHGESKRNGDENQKIKDGSPVIGSYKASCMTPCENALNYLMKKPFATSIYTVQTKTPNIVPSLNGSLSPRSKDEKSSSPLNENEVLSSLFFEQSFGKTPSFDTEIPLESPPSATNSTTNSTTESSLTEEAEEYIRQSSLTKSNNKTEKLPPFHTAAEKQLSSSKSSGKIAFVVTFQITMLLIVFGAFVFPDWTCK